MQDKATTNDVEVTTNPGLSFHFFSTTLKHLPYSLHSDQG